MIPFKGVLISWLILARNSDLALLAASAYSSPLWHLPSFFFSDIQHYAFNISDFAIVDYSITKLFYPNDFTSFI
jgi:hypothetical protein